MNHNIDRILKSAKLRKTQARKALIKVLLGADLPLTQEQIAEKLHHQTCADKTTIYRNLESLVRANAVHKVFLQNSVRHFELSDRCSDTQCHPHFTCTACGKTECLPKILTPMTNIQDSRYKIRRQRVHLEGLCPKCNI